MSKIIRNPNKQNIKIVPNVTDTVTFPIEGGLIIGSDSTASNNIKLHRGGNGILQFIKGDDTTPEGTSSPNITQVQTLGINPIGTITSWIGGLFTGTDNSGYSHSLGSGNTIADANTYLNPLGWYICDGTTPIVANSPLNLDGTRHLPHLTDNRFLQGNTTMGDAGGNNTLRDHTHTFSLTAGGQTFSGNSSSVSLTSPTYTLGTESASHSHTISGGDHSHSANWKWVDDSGQGLVGRYLNDTAYISPSNSTTYGSINTGSSSTMINTSSVSMTAGTESSSHSHSISGGSHNHTVALDHTHSSSSVTGSVGSGSSATLTENRPNYLSVFYIIRVL